MPALALAAAIAAIQLSPPPSPATGCKTDTPTPTRSQAVPGVPRKLGDLPEGRLMRLVMRTVDGCDMMEVRVAQRWVLEPTGARMQPSPVSPGR